jgi:hypothetical protein
MPIRWFPWFRKKSPDVGLTNWLSNIYSADEYWRGSRHITMYQGAVNVVSESPQVTSHETFFVATTEPTFESRFSRADLSGTRVYSILDPTRFSVETFDSYYELIIKEIFVALDTRNALSLGWSNIIRSCRTWESTMINRFNEIVGYRTVMLGEDLSVFRVFSVDHALLAIELLRPVTIEDLSCYGALDRVSRVFATMDQALLSDEKLQFANAGIILNSSSSVSRHVELAKKAGIRR